MGEYDDEINMNKLNNFINVLAFEREYLENIHLYKFVSNRMTFKYTFDEIINKH
jgi:hypothetical protein